MKTSIYAFVALCFLAGAMAVGAEKVHTIVCKKEKQTVKITAAEKSTFKLRIQSNISTGFRWYVASRNKYIEAAGKPAVESEKKGTPGKPEHQIFSFKALKKGSGKIVLQYRRSWEKKEKPAKTLTVMVKIQ